MKTYLRIINPIVAIMVLSICLWAASCQEGNFKPTGMLHGGLSTYFLAKGLFCSSALFILGQILLTMIKRTEGSSAEESGQAEAPATAAESSGVLTDREKAILRYTRTSIHARRTTQAKFALFYYTVVTACGGVVIHEYGTPGSGYKLLLILAFPLVLAIPLYIFNWYQDSKIEELDQERRGCLGGNVPKWQGWWGRVAFELILVLPVPSLIILAVALLSVKDKAAAPLLQKTPAFLQCLSNPFNVGEFRCLAFIGFLASILVLCRLVYGLSKLRNCGHI